jgi:tetratricopeptide (TPR) repeat protein
MRDFGLAQTVLLFCVLFSCRVFASDHLEKGITHLQQDHLEEAKLFFEQRLQANAQDAAANYYLGRVCYRLGLLDQATDHCRKAVEIDEDVAEYHFWLGKALGRKADGSDVIQKAWLAPKVLAEFKGTTELDPSHIEGHIAAAYFHLAAPAILGGGIDKARNEAETLVRLGAREGQVILIEIDEKEGKIDSAEKKYKAFEAGFDPASDDHEFFDR